ncbi:MAG: hypothetical protein RI894_528 [Bacteroidota bacterium]|jgi:gliding motility-associated lipoprotein GldH
MNKKILFQLLAATSALLLTSCGPNYIFKKDYPIANKTWLYRDSLNFEVAIEDTASLYTIFLDLTHSDDFASENAYINIFTKSPDGKRTKNLLSVEMADKTGQWRNGSSSVHLPLQENVHFQQQGNYIFTIAQNNRIDSLQMIESVGFKVEKLP